jgi:flagellar hook-associated protein 3 FlgL
MTFINVSFLASQQSQSRNLGLMRTELNELQRQATTQKKSETFSGLGSQALNVQQYRGEATKIKGYLENITLTQNRLNIQNTTMNSMNQAVQDVLGGLALEIRNGNIDVGSIRTLARNSLQLIQSQTNMQLGDRYLFSGNDILNKPYENASLLQNETTAQVNAWLSGSITSAQLVSNTQALSSQQMGFSASLTTAGPVFTRLDDNASLDVGLVADEMGLDDIMRGLSIIANLPIPDPAVDVATLSDYHAVLNAAESLLQDGVGNLRLAQKGLASKNDYINSAKDRLTSDLKIMEDFYSKAEEVDTTEVIIKLQSLQNQLTASYEVTRIVSQLSLVNFL